MQYGAHTACLGMAPDVLPPAAVPGPRPGRLHHAARREGQRPRSVLYSQGLHTHPAAVARCLSARAIAACSPMSSCRVIARPRLSVQGPHCAGLRAEMSAVLAEKDAVLAHLQSQGVPSSRIQESLSRQVCHALMLSPWLLVELAPPVGPSMHMHPSCPAWPAPVPLLEHVHLSSEGHSAVGKQTRPCISWPASFAASCVCQDARGTRNIQPALVPAHPRTTKVSGGHQSRRTIRPFLSAAGVVRLLVTASVTCDAGAWALMASQPGMFGWVEAQW
jgi:hypothetical protein